jgi:chromate transporter
MPAPLVIFSTFVGFLGGKWVGAVLMSVGMFLPAFTFNIVGIQFFEYLLHIDAVAVALEGIAAGAPPPLHACVAALM